MLTAFAFTLLICLSIFNSAVDYLFILPMFILVEDFPLVIVGVFS